MKLCWWPSFALLGEFLLLRLPSLHFICIVRVVLGRRFLFAGGCFAAVPVWRMLCRRRRDWLKFAPGGCFAAVDGCSGGCFATFLRSLTFAPWTLLFLPAGSVVGFWPVVRVVFSMLLFCCSWCCCVFFFVCTFFQCFSFFSPSCVCVGQALLGRIEIVSVTAFFLMKNVLRHGREKKH